MAPADDQQSQPCTFASRSFAPTPGYPDITWGKAVAMTKVSQKSFSGPSFSETEDPGGSVHLGCPSRVCLGADGDSKPTVPSLGHFCFEQKTDSGS